MRFLLLAILLAFPVADLYVTARVARWAGIPLWVWLGVGETPAAATLAGGAVVLAAIAGNEMIALYGPAKFRRIRAA